MTIITGSKHAKNIESYFENKTSAGYLWLVCELKNLDKLVHAVHINTYMHVQGQRTLVLENNIGLLYIQIKTKRNKCLHWLSSKV